MIRLGYKAKMTVLIQFFHLSQWEIQIFVGMQPVTVHSFN